MGGWCWRVAACVCAPTSLPFCASFCVATARPRSSSSTRASSKRPSCSRRCPARRSSGSWRHSRRAARPRPAVPLPAARLARVPRARAWQRARRAHWVAGARRGRDGGARPSAGFTGRRRGGCGAVQCRGAWPARQGSARGRQLSRARDDAFLEQPRRLRGRSPVRQRRPGWTASAPHAHARRAARRAGRGAGALAFMAARADGDVAFGRDGRSRRSLPARRRPRSVLPRSRPTAASSCRPKSCG